MRTTLSIDDDVLRAAKEIARREKTTAGAVLSTLARKALSKGDDATAEEPALYGFRPFGGRGAIVTNDQIDRLRDEDCY